MGVVYRARDVELDRAVALKSPYRELADDVAARRRFLREARSGAKLTSPYVVSVYEAFEANDRPWIATELVEGPTLQEAISRSGGPMPTSDIVRIGEQIAEALHAAHEKKILHRDVKPGNVLLAPDGRACLGDFGLAASWYPLGHEETATTDSLPLTADGVVGTPAYMSPEQVLGRHLDGRSDLFALGAVLYEMCTGERAFKTGDESSVQDAILHHEPVAIARLNYEVPEELERIVRKALAKNPDDRYASARDMAVDLGALRRRMESGQSATIEERPRRHRLALGVTLGVVAALALVPVATWLLERHPTLPFDGTAPPTVRPFVTWPSQEWEGRFSPDGRWVTFISSRDGIERLWIKSRSGEAVSQLTDETEPVISHAWSPDGSEIVYAVRRRNTLRLAVIDAPIPGARRVIVETSEVVGGWPRLVAWTGGGIYLEDRSGLWRVDAASGDLTRLELDPGCCERIFGYEMHPDGARVAFVGIADGRQDLFVSTLGGTDVTRVTSDAFAEDSPLWLGRDGSRLVYRSHRTGQFDLWLTDLEHESTRQIPFTGTIAALGGASAAGDAFTVRVQEQSIALWRLDAQTGRTTRLGGDRLGELAPSLSAAGDVIAFQRAKPNIDISYSAMGSRVYLASLDASGLSNVRMVVENGFSPLVSPDGSRLAYLTTTTGRDFAVNVEVFDIGTGRTLTIAADVCFRGYRPVPLVYLSATLTWDPREPRLYFVERTDVGVPTLRRRAVTEDAADPQHIADLGAPGDIVAHPALSPAGDRMAFVAYPEDRPFEQRLVVVDIERGTRRVVTPAPSLDSRRTLRLLGWDGASLVVAALRARTDLNHDVDLYRIAPDGAALRIAEVNDAIGETVRLDASGRRVLLTATRDRNDDLYAVSLDDGSLSRLTEMDMGTGVTIGDAVAIGGEDDVVFTRQEDQVDVWIVESRGRSRAALSETR
jgi:Tol biopolymer transport system component